LLEDIDGVGLLWDQVKKCGVNDDRRSEYDPNVENNGSTGCSKWELYPKPTN